MAGEAEVFLPYEAVLDRLDDAARQLPGASVLHREGLAILRVGTASGLDVTDARPEIWLQGGLHACEWIGPVVVLRLMDELIRSSELRGRATWYLLPVVDARGYQRTWPASASFGRRRTEKTRISISHTGGVRRLAS